MSTAVLIDLDGVLRLQKSPAPDAGFFLNTLSGKQIPHGVLSNSTVITRNEITQLLLSAGVTQMPVIVTPSDLLKKLIAERNIKSLNMYAAAHLREEFRELHSGQPEYVVIGDMEQFWTYDTINEILNHLLNGSKLIALHNNRHWINTAGQRAADAGFFVAGFEFATGIKAEVLGKPAGEFFRLGLSLVTGEPSSDFIMVGDDIVNDMEGAGNAGGKGLLVLTGKTTQIAAETYTGTAQFKCAATLTEAADLLNKMGI